MKYVLTADDIYTMWYCVDSKCMSDDMKELALKLGELYVLMMNNCIYSIIINLEV